MALKNKLLWVVIPLIILGIFIFWIIFSYLDKNTPNPEVIEITSEELSQNKEKYENKRVILTNAYIPSEAFIYVKDDSLGDRIFIQPPNKQYCRNFNLIGTLRRDVVKQWIFYVEEAECVE